MKTYLTILLLLIANTQSNCSIGCSICLEDNTTCRLCDFRNGYAMNIQTNTCVFNSNNCLMHDIDGTCLSCPNTHFPNNFSCVPLTIQGDTNCASYSDQQVCLACTNDTYLLGGVCTAATPIQHCDTYGGTNGVNCLVCQDGFIPALDYLSCDAVDVTDNCSKYSYAICEQCQDKVEYDNAYIIKAFDFGAQNNLEGMLGRLLHGPNNGFVESVCINNQVNNCLIHTRYDKCNVCMDGFYLTADFQCMGNPVFFVPHCYLLIDADNCYRCNNGYYIFNGDQTQCVASTPVPDCSIYSFNSNECTRCMESHYLVNGNCMPRTTINDCAVHHPTIANNCQQCDPLFVLVNNNTDCMSVIGNCLNYETNNNTGTPAFCNQCNDGMYFNGVNCVNGNVDFCRVYTGTAGLCGECLLDYYLQNEVCHERTFAYNHCSSFDHFTDTPCLTCSFNTRAYAVTVGCAQIVSVPFCAVYSDYQTCSQCHEGYILNTTNNSCSLNQTGNNCLIQIDTACVRCQTGFEAYASDPICRPVFAIDMANCASVDEVNDGVDYQCHSCSPNHIPFSFYNSGLCMCVNTTEQNIQVQNGCAVVDNVLGNTFCRKCKPGFFLVNDYSCVSSFSSAHLLIRGYIVDNVFGRQVVFEEMYVPMINGFETCSVAAYGLFDRNNIHCVKCASGYIAVQGQCPTIRSFFGMKGNQFGNWNVAQAFSTVQCQLAVTQNNDGPALDSNCKTYKIVGNGQYCQECHFGYSGTIQTMNNVNYVTCQTAVVGCDTSVFMGTGMEVIDTFMDDMFGFTLSDNFTCHKCTNNNEIPFLHMGYFNELLPYGMTNNNGIPSNSLIKDGHKMKCRVPDRASFGIDVNDGFSFPSNCGLGMLITNRTSGANYSNGTIRCMACKNGYTKVLNTQGTYIVDCQPIANCSMTTVGGIFNGCQDCALSHSHTVSVTSPINYASCTQRPYITDNCQLGDANGCKACKKDCVMNSSGICDKIDLGCGSYFSPNSLPIVLGNIQIPFLSAKYYLDTASYGCVNCGSGEVSMLLNPANTPRSSYQCVFSSFLASFRYPTENNFISNCLNYSNNASSNCRRCSTGYVVSTSNNECFQNTNLPNCVFAVNSSTCSVCEDGYTIVNGTCTIENIPECRSYSGGIALTCTACNDTFKLSGNSCVDGGVTGCAQYIGDNCTSCLNGYFLQNGACLILSNELGCAGGSTNFLSQLTCNGCLNGYFQTSITLLYQSVLCYYFPNQVNFCAQYNTDGSLCINCIENHYLNNNQCFPRQNLDDNCMTYFPNSDACSACDNGYQIDGVGCSLIRFGNYNCFAFDANQICTQCTNHTYLDNTNNCIPVTTIVDNCHIYSADGFCFKCNENFLASNGLCQAVVASNCKFVSTPTSCSACYLHYKLKFQSGAFNCVPITFPDEANRLLCTETNDFSGLCMACLDDHYPNMSSPACLPLGVDEIISNCLEVNQQKKCVRCEPNYVYRKENNTCVLDIPVHQLNPNCDRMVYELLPTCTACMEGFYFDSHDCVPCSGNGSCSFCNATDPTMCYMCASGFYMSSYGNCVPVPSNGRRLMEVEEEEEEQGFYGRLVEKVMAFIS